jgi:hypothetical protein
VYTHPAPVLVEDAAAATHWFDLLVREALSRSEFIAPSRTVPLSPNAASAVRRVLKSSPRFVSASATSRSVLLSCRALRTTVASEQNTTACFKVPNRYRAANSLSAALVTSELIDSVGSLSPERARSTLAVPAPSVCDHDEARQRRGERLFCEL